MIINDSIYNKLTKLGLNKYEIKVWLAILSKGIVNASEVPMISGVPRSRTYDILESLERKGIVILKLGKPRKYIAISPNKIIDVLIKKEKQAKDNLIKNIESKESQILQEIEEVFSNKDDNSVNVDEIINFAKNKSSQLENIEMILKSAQKEIKIFTNSSTLVDMILLFKQEFKNVKERNVDIKAIIYFENEEDKKIIINNSDFEIKNLDNKISNNFLIIDDKEINFTAVEEDKKKVSLWINTSFFGLTLSKMFDIAWGKSKLVEEKLIN